MSDNNNSRTSLFSWMSRDRLGVPDDEPPIMDNPGFINYCKLLGRKLNQIISVNLLMLAGNFPIVFALLVFTGYFSTQTTAPLFATFPQLSGAMAGSQSAYTSALIGTLGAQMELNVLSTVDYVLLALTGLILFTFGPVMAGSTYLFRNMLREEPIFLWQDFWSTIKKNARQAILFGILDLVIMALIIYDIVFFNLNYSQSMFAVMMFFAALVLAVMYITMRMYIYPMMITFDLSIIKLLKNALLFTVLGVKRNAIALVSIAVILIFNFMLMSVYLPIGIILPFVITFGILGYTGTYYAYPVISKYMIEPYYNKDGTLKSQSAEADESEDVETEDVSDDIT